MRQNLNSITKVPGIPSMSSQVSIPLPTWWPLRRPSHIREGSFVQVRRRGKLSFRLQNNPLSHFFISHQQLSNWKNAKDPHPSRRLRRWASNTFYSIKPSAWALTESCLTWLPKWQCPCLNSPLVSRPLFSTASPVYWSILGQDGPTKKRRLHRLWF